MTRRAILHIGPPKTGTSAIQASLSHNRSVLARFGLLYPGTGRDHSATLLALFRGQAQDYIRARNRTVPSGTSPISAKQFAAVQEQLRGRDWHTLILSTELMYGLKRPVMKQIKQWLDQYVDSYQLVAVVRDPVDWAVSYTQQRFKREGDVDTLLAQPRAMRLQRTFQRWEDVLGAGQHQILAFEDLIADPAGMGAAFLTRLELASAAAALSREVAVRNESLSWEAAMMMAELNTRRPFFVEGKRSGARSGAELGAFTGIRGQRFDLPDATRRQIFDETRADIAWVGERFGITRYDYPAADLRPSSNPAGFSPEFITGVGERMADMANEIRIQRGLLQIAELRLEGRAGEAERVRRRFEATFPAEARFRDEPDDDARAVRWAAE